MWEEGPRFLSHSSAMQQRHHGVDGSGLILNSSLAQAMDDQPLLQACSSQASHSDWLLYQKSEACHVTSWQRTFFDGVDSGQCNVKFFDESPQRTIPFRHTYLIIVAILTHSLFIQGTASRPTLKAEAGCSMHLHLINI